MEKKSIAKNYAFLAVMLGAMILGAILDRKSTRLNSSHT